MAKINDDPNKELNRKQLEFCEQYITTDKMIKDIAADLNLNVGTCYQWMQYANIKKYIRERTDAYWNNIYAKATEKLIENINMNDTKAIIYALDHSLFKDEAKWNLPEITINITGKEEDED